MYRQQLHSSAIADVEALLPAGTVKRTPKGCKAAIGFAPTGARLSLPISVKGAMLGKNARYLFNRSSSGNWIWLCRPMISFDCCLVLTGHLASRTGLSFESSHRSNWHRYLVPDQQLAEVLTGLYKAVERSSQAFKLPSGQMLDISGLQVMPLDQFSVPVSPTDQKAQSNWALRQSWFPTLEFVIPDVQHTTVRAVVEGVRLHDASAIIERRLARQMYMYLNLHKRAGKTFVQHCQGDYDALWVFHPNLRHFWLIPARVLVERGIMAAGPDMPGKYNLPLIDLAYKQPSRGRAANGLNQWIKAYCYDSQEPGIEDKVRRALQAIKAMQ